MRVVVFFLAVLSLWASSTLACGQLLAGEGVFGSLVGAHERPQHPSAPTYVVLHGLSEESTQLQGVSDVLRAKGYGVLRLDLLGHGRTVVRSRQAVPRVIWFQDQVAAVAQAIRSLRLPEVHLVGHSYGGALALAVANQLGSTSVASLSLFAPYLMRMDAYFAAQFCPVGGAAPWISALFAMADPWADLCPAVNAFFLEGLARNIRRTEAGTRVDPLAHEARLRGALAALRGARMTDFLRNPPSLASSLPVRIWIGTHDRLIPVSMVHEFARTMRRRGHRALGVVEVPHGTHHLPQELPGLVTAP